MAPAAESTRQHWLPRPTTVIEVPAQAGAEQDLLRQKDIIGTSIVTDTPAEEGGRARRSSTKTDPDDAIKTLVSSGKMPMVVNVQSDSPAPAVCVGMLFGV